MEIVMERKTDSERRRGRRWSESERAGNEKVLWRREEDSYRDGEGKGLGKGKIEEG